MINLNGVVYTTLDALEAAMSAADLSDSTKVCIRNDFNGTPNNSTPDMHSVVQGKILAAMAFGQNLMASYGATNVLSGYNVEQIQFIMAKTAMVQSALLSGSLYVALDELSKIEIDGTIITGVRITEFRNKIQDYLGIPRT
jgi:hypothetical protein